MLEKYLDSRISVKDRWEGIDYNWRIANRIAGGLRAMVGTIFLNAAVYNDSKALYIGASLFIIEGLGDLFSGNHHYVTSRLGRIITRNPNWPHKE